MSSGEVTTICRKYFHKNHLTAPMIVAWKRENNVFIEDAVDMIVADYEGATQTSPQTSSHIYPTLMCAMKALVPSIQ